MRTQNYRDQHDQLLRIATELAAITQAGKAGTQSDVARRHLSELAGKLNLHLAMEDKSLYPALLSHPDEKVRATAKKFVDEMGGIAAAFTGYLAHWPTPGSIAKAPQDFAKETAGIIKALGDRIQKENTVLYPLADKAP